MPHLLSTSSGRRSTVEEQLAAQMAKQRRLVKNVVAECGFVPFIDGKGQIAISVYVKHTFLVPLGLTTLILEIQTPALCFLKEETSAAHRESLLVSNRSHELWGHVCYHL